MAVAAAQHIEDAVLAAIDFFDKIYKDKALKDVLLEEVREKDDQTWEVTIGYSRVIEGVPAMHALVQAPKYERVYKVLAVDKSTGRVSSMTIRNP